MPTTVLVLSPRRPFKATYVKTIRLDALAQRQEHQLLTASDRKPRVLLDSGKDGCTCTSPSVLGNVPSSAATKVTYGGDDHRDFSQSTLFGLSPRSTRHLTSVDSLASCRRSETGQDRVLAGTSVALVSHARLWSDHICSSRSVWTRYRPCPAWGRSRLCYCLFCSPRTKGSPLDSMPSRPYFAGRVSSTYVLSTAFRNVYALLPPSLLSHPHNISHTSTWVTFWLQSGIYYAIDSSWSQTGYLDSRGLLRRLSLGICPHSTA
ncbi:unnamed protein product [Parajaminaea phylloscopi]